MIVRQIIDDFADGLNRRLGSTWNSEANLNRIEIIAASRYNVAIGNLLSKTTQGVADSYGTDSSILFWKGDQSSSEYIFGWY